MSDCLNTPYETPVRLEVARQSCTVEEGAESDRTQTTDQKARDHRRLSVFNPLPHLEAVGPEVDRRKRQKASTRVSSFASCQCASSLIVRGGYQAVKWALILLDCGHLNLCIRLSIKSRTQRKITCRCQRE